MSTNRNCHLKMFFYDQRLLLLLFSLFKLCLSINNLEQCFPRDSCTNSSNYSPSIYDDELFIQSRNCFCDSVCEQYGDCCDKHSKSSINRYQCVDFLLPTINNKSTPFNRLSVWMRTECLPIYYGSQVFNQCQNFHNQSFDDNPILFIPVTSLQTNITYRNYYCAYCNNDINENIQFWEYKPFCYGDGSEKSYLTLNDDDQVQYYIHNLTKNCLKTILYPHERGNSKPSVFIRPCKQSLPPTCPVGTSIDLAQNCSSFGTAYRYIPNSNLAYRNPYCAECNSQNSTDEITCLDPALRSSIPPITLIRIHPLSILFDPTLLKRYLNNNTIPQIIYSIEYNCTKPNELYNLYEKKCSPISNTNQELVISMKCSYPMQTLIQLNETIIYDNGSLDLHLNNHSIFLTIDDYVILSDQRILFCADQWINSNQSSLMAPSFPFYRDILSIICTSISLVCLLLFVIVFCMISSLHNLPGKCLLLLSISLFIGQFTFISISNLTTINSICIISAILIHYFYLSSFIWLLIISINIHSTFNHQILPQDKLKKKNFRLIIYNIIVWSSTGLIILIACLIQLFIPQSDFSPGYGLIYCSISKVHAMIIFFLVPIGGILFIVTILFIKTLLTIYRSHNIAKLANTSSTSNMKDKNLVFVYARLASLMGIQWILLIAALVIRQTWIWIMFEIINSLPGLFICLGFLCSKHVFNSLKEKISMKLIIRRQSSRSNTTTSTILMSPPVLSTKKFRF